MPIAVLIESATNVDLFCLFQILLHLVFLNYYKDTTYYILLSMGDYDFKSSGEI